jgi:predicted metal-dependent hydrolase
VAELPKTPVRTGGRSGAATSACIKVDGLAFDVHRSPRRRTLQITVDRSGELSIAAPDRATDEDLVAFVQEKLLWVHTKIEEKARLQRRAPRKEFVDGEGFLYLGRSYRLRVVDRQLVDLTLQNGRFHLRRDRLRRARDTFVDWYIRNGQRWLVKKVAEYSARMSVPVSEIKVQDLGYRWGSFSQESRVLFHWKVILLPPKIAEYVVVHELAHGLHPNHSGAFWQVVERYMPDWQIRKIWLAEHGIEVEGL